MKFQSNNLLVNLTRTEVNLLTTEIKETLCKNFKKEKKRKFTSAEFSDIYNRRKSRMIKRILY